MLCHLIGKGLKLLLKRPIRSQRSHAPTSAAAPPIPCTTTLPANSMKPFVPLGTITWSHGHMESHGSISSCTCRKSIRGKLFPGIVTWSQMAPFSSCTSRKQAEPLSGRTVPNFWAFESARSQDVASQPLCAGTE